MKLSLNFVKDYVDLDENLSVKEIAENMTKVGNEYDTAEKLVNSTKLIIGEIKECSIHPDSNHLHLCKVDIGNQVLDIVCGAPNARKGIKVIVAQVGAELPGDFKIKKSTIRGQESNGMLCALYEIGIEKKFLSDQDKNGIHELPIDAPVGEDPIKYMKLDDEVIDFDLTANRGDLLSILGMAYELGAIYDKKVKPVETTYKENGEDINNSFSVEIKTDNCKMFLAKKANNVVIKESPEFIKNRLIASGIRPINNVVDISNYVMLEIGQPLHFYDADTLGNKILVRMANENEELTTLDSIKRNLNENDIVITDGKKAIGLAGVMGGLDTEVEEKTKNIIIEAAIFDSVKVRMTSNKILRSEASNRFEKGLDPERTYMAIERACNLLEKYADAQIQTGIVKYDVTDNKEKVIEITQKEINEVLGTNISKEDIQDVFRKLDLKTDLKENKIIVTVPTRRIDISITADLIEEVGRIYGVDNIKGKLPLAPMKVGNLDRTLRKIRTKMSNMGLNETLSYILVSQKDAHKYSSAQFEEVKLLDPLTEERNTLRYSIIPSLYKIYEYNKSRENKDVFLFEIGKGFGKIDDKYIEEQKLCIIMTGKYHLGIENHKNVNFYDIKGVAEELLDYLGYENRYSFIIPKNIPQEFHPGQTAEISVNNSVVGIIGRIHPQIEKEDVFVMEVNLDKLLEKRVEKTKFKEIPKFPAIDRDIALIVMENIEIAKIEKTIKSNGKKLLESFEVFDIYRNEKLGENKKSIAINLKFRDKEKTLTDEEVNTVMEQIISGLTKIGAELRK